MEDQTLILVITRSNLGKPFWQFGSQKPTDGGYGGIYISLDILARFDPPPPGGIDKLDFKKPGKPGQNKAFG